MSDSLVHWGSPTQLTKVSSSQLVFGVAIYISSATTLLSGAISLTESIALAGCLSLMSVLTLLSSAVSSTRLSGCGA